MKHLVTMVFRYEVETNEPIREVLDKVIYPDFDDIDADTQYEYLDGSFTYKEIE